jgi:peptide chain release factor subunit 3
MDESKEEQAKGKTVEVGRAHFNTEVKRFTIFDAPGHKNYVPDMIMGAACADIGGLVISARKGEFEAGFDRDGQTREHAQLAISLGIQKLVVIVNKMDDPSVKWAKERFDEIHDKILPFLGTCGYKEEDIMFCPISGLRGDNIIDGENAANWWTGKSLIETLDHIQLEHRDPKADIRIPVLDKLKDEERGGQIIFGKVDAGTLRLGDKLSIMPNNIPVYIDYIYNGKNEEVEVAYPGENIKIKLWKFEDDDAIRRGDVLCPMDPLMPASELLECELQVLDLLAYKPILSKGYQCVIHLHTIAMEVTIKDLVMAWDKNELGEEIEKKQPKFAKSNQRIICRISSKIPMAMEKFDVFPLLGKFTLRDQGRTIGIGKIIKYKPSKVLDYQQKQEALKLKVAAESNMQNKEDNTVFFNMETGEEEKKQGETKQMEAIAEGEEDEG